MPISCQNRYICLQLSTITPSKSKRAPTLLFIAIYLLFITNKNKEHQNKVFDAPSVLSRTWNRYSAAGASTVSPSAFFSQRRRPLLLPCSGCELCFFLCNDFSLGLILSLFCLQTLLCCQLFLSAMSRLKGIHGCWHRSSMHPEAALAYAPSSKCAPCGHHPGGASSTIHLP